ncbi:hypothetical protein H8356DRAFT_1345059 [Neocallimastix lanati (nom. inval.)]|nr:hypothetical protein H8356DRAFT_1345059 [Neocallimastix sp. JGI-2020a]
MHQILFQVDNINFYILKLPSYLSQEMGFIQFYDIQKSKFNNFPISILNIFTNGTLYITSKFNYQVFITRTYVKYLNKKKFHCDFEKGISNTAEKVFPKINTKYLHITNNAPESFNGYLNNFISKKPSFYKLVYALKQEKYLSYNDFKRKSKIDEIYILIEIYKIMETKLIDNGSPRNDIVNLY